MPVTIETEQKEGTPGAAENTKPIGFNTEENRIDAQPPVAGRVSQSQIKPPEKVPEGHGANDISGDEDVDTCAREILTV